MPSFADLLRTNPRGWGNATSDPMVDENGNLINDPARYGGLSSYDPNQRVRDAASSVGGTARDVALGLSGISMASEGGSNLARALESGDPVRGLGAVGQIGLAGLPAVGALRPALADKMFATVPRVAGIVGGGTAASAAADGVLSSSPAMAEGANPVQQLFTEKAGIDGRLKDALARRDANRPRNRAPSPQRDPKFTEADNEVRDLEAKMQAVNQMIAAENDKTSPEAKLAAEKAQKLQDEEFARAQLDKPFAERHPNIAAGLAVGSPLASVLLARYGLNKIAGSGKTLMSDLLKARKEGDVMGMAEKAAALQSWNRKAPWKQGATIGVSAGIPVEARLVGDNVDKFSLPPGSKAQVAASDRLSDPLHYVKDSVPAIVSGLVGAGVGAKTAKPAPRDEAKGMIGLYAGKQPDALAEALRSGARSSAQLQPEIGLFEQAARVRSAGPALEPSRNPIQPLSAGARQSAPNTPAVTSASPSKDSVWDASIGRWRGVDGKFRGGAGPAND